MAAGQMAGFMKGLISGMRRPDLRCLWGRDYWKVRVEAERLARRLPVIFRGLVIFDWCGSLEWERSEWV